METIKNLKVNLESKILSSKNVVIVPHSRIDFDAFASAVGISLIVEKLERKSMILIDDPIYNLDSSVKGVIDDARKKFNIVNRENCLKEINSNDLVVLTDVNKSNLICLSEQLKEINKENIIVVDHHDEGPTTVDAMYKYINTTVSSASEIVVKLLNLFKVKYCPEIANYLLAGIHLDTCRLTKNTTPDTFKIVARLMESGASSSVIDDWFAEDFESDKKVLELVSKAIISKYSYAIVMADEDCEYTREEIAKVADRLLKYGVDAAFAIGYIEKNLISISARSKDKVNVGEIMKELDGGGNKHSAATKLTDTNIKEVGKRLIKLIEPPYIIK